MKTHDIIIYKATKPNTNGLIICNQARPTEVKLDEGPFNNYVTLKEWDFHTSSTHFCIMQYFQHFK